MVLEEKDCFYLHGGGILHNLEELLGALKSISEDVLNFHVNSDKNDFSNWVESILGENKLAKKLRSVNKRDEMIKAVEKRIIAIEKAINKRKIIQQIKDSHNG